MKSLLILATLIGSSASFAMSTIDVDFAYTLPGYAAGTASALITELKTVTAGASNLSTPSISIYGCLVATREIDAQQADAKVYATIHCDGSDSLTQESLAGLISGSYSEKVGISLMPVLAKPNPGVVMSNARSTGMSTVDVDFSYTLPSYAAGSAAALIAELNKVGMAGANLKNPALYGGCLIYTSEIDEAQSDALVYATIHCDGNSTLTQESLASIVSGTLSSQVGLALKPLMIQHNN